MSVLTHLRELRTLERVDVEYSIVRKVFRFELPFNRSSLGVVGCYYTEIVSGLGVALNKMTDCMNLLRILGNRFRQPSSFTFPM
jgi:hypothetical protein